MEVWGRKIFNIVLFTIVFIITSSSAIDVIVPFVTSDMNGGAADTISNPIMLKNMAKFLHVALSILHIISFLCIMLSLGNFIVSFIHYVSYGDFDNVYNEDNLYESSLVFIIPNEKFGTCKKVEIDLGKLSECTRDAVIKLQDDLDKLYNSAKSSKRSFATYKTYRTYLLTLSDEMRSAVTECDNEYMERILLDNLYIVRENIGILQKRVDEDLRFEQDIKDNEAKLKAEGYSPFSVIEQLNKLM